MASERILSMSPVMGSSVLSEKSISFGTGRCSILLNSFCLKLKLLSNSSRLRFDMSPAVIGTFSLFINFIRSVMFINTRLFFSVIPFVSFTISDSIIILSNTSFTLFTICEDNPRNVPFLYIKSHKKALFSSELNPCNLLLFSIKRNNSKPFNIDFVITFITTNCNNKL